MPSVPVARADVEAASSWAASRSWSRFVILRAARIEMKGGRFNDGKGLRPPRRGRILCDRSATPTLGFCIRRRQLLQGEDTPYPATELGQHRVDLRMEAL